MPTPIAARPSRRYEAWMVGPPTADHSHRAWPRERSGSRATYIRSGARPAMTQRAAANGIRKRTALCGQPLPGRVCLNCFGLAKAPRQNDPETEPLEGTSLMQRDDEGDEFDPVVRAESEQTLAEWLSWNVRVLLPARLLPIVEYLIGNINENGYLDPGVTVEDAASTMKVSVADTMRALRAIQSVEPWGGGD